MRKAADGVYKSIDLKSEKERSHLPIEDNIEKLELNEEDFETPVSSGAKPRRTREPARRKSEEDEKPVSPGIKMIRFRPYSGSCLRD